MKIFMTVTFDDGRVEKLTVGPRDQLAWEKAGTDRSIGAVVQTYDKIADHYSIAFAAMRRQGLFSGSERDLIETADVEIGWPDKVETEDRSDENPTQ